MKQTSLDAFVKALDGTIDEQTTFKIDGYEGINAKISTQKDAKINYRAILIGNFHYQLIITTANDYANENDVSHFFNSFELL